MEVISSNYGFGSLREDNMLVSRMITSLFSMIKLVTWHGIVMKKPSLIHLLVALETCWFWVRFILLRVGWYTETEILFHNVIFNGCNMLTTLHLSRWTLFIGAYVLVLVTLHNFWLVGLIAPLCNAHIVYLHCASPLSFWCLMFCIAKCWERLNLINSSIQYA